MISEGGRRSDLGEGSCWELGLVGCQMMRVGPGLLLGRFCKCKSNSVVPKHVRLGCALASVMQLLSISCSSGRRALRALRKPSPVPFLAHVGNLCVLLRCLVFKVVDKWRVRKGP